MIRLKEPLSILKTMGKVSNVLWFKSGSLNKLFIHRAITYVGSRVNQAKGHLVS